MQLILEQRLPKHHLYFPLTLVGVLQAVESYNTNSLINLCHHALDLNSGVAVLRLREELCRSSLTSFLDLDGR